jgi:outer membrane protein OmpA-like peptidoglycan-associated protein
MQKYDSSLDAEEACRATENYGGRRDSMKKVLFLSGLMMVFLLGTSCTTTYHFGVMDRAYHVPDEFDQTEAVVAKAEKSEGAKYCPEKICNAKELGRQAAETYWGCNNVEAMRLLTLARQMAVEAEACGPPPVAAAPAPAPAPAPPPEKICMTLNVQFDLNKADVKPKYLGAIEEAANFMKDNPEATAVIEGHADNLGNYEYNIKLSERRAVNVKTIMVEKYGIESSRLSTKGYGYTKPIASNKTAEGRQKNRRIDAVIECVK